MSDRSNIGAIHIDPHDQRGNALIAALFMIIVVAALGVFAIRIGSSQQQTANLSLLVSRADAAAFSGLEYGARSITSNQPCGALPQINGFNVVVGGCNPIDVVTHLVGGVATRTFFVTATAVTATAAYGNPDYVQRRMTRTVSQIPVTAGGFAWEHGGAAY